jgi:hypothetical protein
VGVPKSAILVGKSGIYIPCGKKNEKTFVLTKEISYAESYIK